MTRQGTRSWSRTPLSLYTRLSCANSQTKSQILVYDFGAESLFDKILSLLWPRGADSRIPGATLLFKVIDRVLYKLDDHAHSYVHRILVVIEPLLIYEDCYVRVGGCEIISNIFREQDSHMISTESTLRPDIDQADEYARNTTGCVLSLVTSALDIPSLLPFPSPLGASQQKLAVSWPPE